jgi:hypothetical protein
MAREIQWEKSNNDELQLYTNIKYCEYLTIENISFKE